MTVQKNKYFIGSYVFAILDDVKNQQIYYMKINGIYRQDDNIIYQDEIGVEAKEENIFPDKQSALAELNKIKVGDEVYYIYIADCGYKRHPFLSCGKVKEVRGDTYIIGSYAVYKDYVAKTEEDLLKEIRSY